MRPTTIRTALLIAGGMGLTVLVYAAAAPAPRTREAARTVTSQSEIQRGLAIAPVPLDLTGKNPALVARGSYIINAQGSCNDCHTCPSYAPEHNPYTGGDGRINAADYLAGGVPFGPFVSANLTPDAAGRPAGLTLDEFVEAIRTGRDPDHPEQVLQVMPWPILRNMTDRDLHAVYEYLSAIPAAEPTGTCTGPSE